jgi:hypothetical protein
LLELAKLRKQRLLDALSLYKLLSESDGVEQWIGEKVSSACFLPFSLVLLVSVWLEFVSTALSSLVVTIKKVADKPKALLMRTLPP